jgi:radical SAM superfamily enzyme with C-terminal helix-hairpin-helix motif
MGHLLKKNRYVESIPKEEVTVKNMKQLRKERKLINEWDMVFLITGFFIPGKTGNGRKK